MYEYDAWGNILSTTGSMASTLGIHNPLRYRGYVYDTETGLYYLQSRYYNPYIGRFINVDGLISTGQGLLGYNMFAYCGNNPVNRVDPTGKLFWMVVGAIAVVALVVSVPSSHDQTPYERQAAAVKYNTATVNVYKRGVGVPDKSKINVEFYDVGIEREHTNINVDKSLEVESVYEMEAVLDVIMQSEYYSEDMFGSKDFMAAQWIAHNKCHDIAASGSIGYTIMQTLSGSNDPLASSNALDIRSKGNMLRRQEIIYTIISWAI